MVAYLYQLEEASARRDASRSCSASEARLQREVSYELSPHPLTVVHTLREDLYIVVASGRLLGAGDAINVRVAANIVVVALVGDSSRVRHGERS